MVDLKAALESLCPCLAYDISPDGNRLDIRVNRKYGDDRAVPTPLDFCCCYYRHMAGCNLVLEYRDMPGKDTPVQPGAAVVSGDMGVGDSQTQTGKATTAHEFGHVVLGGGQKGAHQASCAFGTIMGGDRDKAGQDWARDPIDSQGLNQPEKARIHQALEKFGQNKYPDCEGRVPKELQGAPADFQRKVDTVKNFFK